MTIPKILSQQRQYLLGAFGAVLLFIALGILSADIERDFFVILAGLVLSGFVAQVVRDRNYQKLIREGDPEALIEEAKKALWKAHYKWAIRFVLRARGAAKDDTWQSGYPFLFGAQLALRQKDAANTRIDIISSIKKAAEAKSGYFSKQDSLRQFAGRLADVRSEIAKDGMVEGYAAHVRAEIDLVIQATQAS